MRLVWAALSLTALTWTVPVLGAEQTEAVEVGVEPGQRAPGFVLTTVTGAPVALADSLGSGPVVLSFWATWCPSCKQAMPKLNELRAAYAPKGARFFAIDYREEARKVARVAKKWPVEATVLLDRDGEVTRTYKVVGIPTTVVLDQKGVVRFYGHASRDALESTLKGLL